MIQEKNACGAHIAEYSDRRPPRPPLTLMPKIEELTAPGAVLAAEDAAAEIMPLPEDPLDGRDDPKTTGKDVLDEIVSSNAAAASDAVRAFDMKRLATPADWADLEDFDEEAVIASMTKRVEETWLATQKELADEKSGKGDASWRPTEASPTSSPRPSSSPGPPPDCAIVKGDTVKIHSLSSRPELNDQVATAERFNKSKGRFAVRLADGSSILLKPHNLAPHTLAQ